MPLNKIKIYSTILKNNGVTIFEYHPKQDCLTIYDHNLEPLDVIDQYLDTLKADTPVHPDDRWKMIDFFSGNISEPIEIKTMDPDGRRFRKHLSALRVTCDENEVILGCVKDVTASKKREELLLDQSQRDHMTMLYNHVAGKELVNEYLLKKNPFSSCGLLVVDIDYFKQVNDNYGHLFGDKVLIKLSHLFTEMFEEKDILIRAGGDEFVLFIKDITQSILLKRTTQLESAIRKLTFPENDYTMTVSMGICFLPENTPGYTYDQLFENADWALYQAKEGGRNKFVFCDNLRRFELSALENTRMAISGYEQAISDHEFKIYLQPRYSLTDRSIVGAEALLRWVQKDGTILYPNEFMPFYEENGCVVDLDFYVFEQVAAFMAKNKALGRRQVPISVNASPLHIGKRTTPARYLEILKKYQIAPELTSIELNESATLSEYDQVCQLFQELDHYGIHTAIDNFGSGYSILNTTFSLPVHTYKLDRTLINNCTQSEKGTLFLQHIIQMLKELNYHVVCEGIETEQQAAIIQEAGCTEAQGYLFAAPMPLEEYEALMYQE